MKLGIVQNVIPNFTPSPNPLPCRQAGFPLSGKGNRDPHLASPFQGGGLPACWNDSAGMEGGEMTF